MHISVIKLVQAHVLYDHYHNCNVALERESDCCFLKQRFHIILLDTSCENHQNGYKNMARFTKIWREVFEKYYKGCRLLFKENIPLGRPLKFSHPNSEVAVHRTVRRPPG